MDIAQMDQTGGGDLTLNINVVSREAGYGIDEIRSPINLQAIKYGLATMALYLMQLATLIASLPLQQSIQWLLTMLLFLPV